MEEVDSLVSGIFILHFMISYRGTLSCLYQHQHCIKNAMHVTPIKSDWSGKILALGTKEFLPLGYTVVLPYFSQRENEYRDKEWAIDQAIFPSVCENCLGTRPSNDYLLLFHRHHSGQATSEEE